MRLRPHQKVILLVGILGVIIGIYGKINGWERNTVFNFIYTGTGLLWVAFIGNSKHCGRRGKDTNVQKPSKIK